MHSSVCAPAPPPIRVCPPLAMRASSLRPWCFARLHAAVGGVEGEDCVGGGVGGGVGGVGSTSGSGVGSSSGVGNTSDRAGLSSAGFRCAGFRCAGSSGRAAAAVPPPLASRVGRVTGRASCSDDRLAAAPVRLWHTANQAAAPAQRRGFAPKRQMRETCGGSRAAAVRTTGGWGGGWGGVGWGGGGVGWGGGWHCLSSAVRCSMRRRRSSSGR